jgi:hypothetical protein
MSKATYPPKLPLSIKKAAQHLARQNGVSVNQFIAAAVREKVGLVEPAAEFFAQRAGSHPKQRTKSHSRRPNRTPLAVLDCCRYPPSFSKNKQIVSIP